MSHGKTQSPWSRVLALLPLVALFGACNGGASFVGKVRVPKSNYEKGESIRVLIEVPNGAVGTHVRLQKKVGDSWKEVANYNPGKKCPVMQERAGGGYKFVSKRSPMCRRVDGKWSVLWQSMKSRQCQDGAGPVGPGVYRVCVARFAKKCQVREGSFGFERPRGASKFICSEPFTID